MTRKISTRHPNKLSKILDISWFQLLDDNFIFLKLQRLPNDLGTFPPSLLFDKSILMADVRFPMALEIVPCKSLYLILRNSRRLKPYNQIGIEELNYWKIDQGVEEKSCSGDQHGLDLEMN